MLAFRFFMLFLAVRFGTAHDTVYPDFESDFVSWPRLKRQAGYFSESYQYRGGLYKFARDYETDVSQCLEFDKTRCLEWETEVINGKGWKRGACQCRGWTAQYCSAWSCSHLKMVPDGECSSGGCVDKIHAEHAQCACDVEAPHGKYCKGWKCTENASDGSRKREVFYCLMENHSGDFCIRWRGDIESSYKIDSAVCQCQARNRRFCHRWTCKERGLIRCAAHEGGWCSLEIAIGVGGGLGALFIFLGAWFYKTGSKSVKCYSLSVCWLLGCLPWAIGVVIWGGMRGVPWVIVIWFSAASLATTWMFRTGERAAQA